MQFATITSAAFFLIVLPMSWVLMPRQSQWKPFILGASYIFYGWFKWSYALILAGFTIGNQLFAVLIFRARDPFMRRALLALAVVFNLGILGLYKYAGFFVESFKGVFDSFNIEVPTWILSITLPIGISFITFQALSYVIDVYRKEITPATFMDFAVYLSFFPHVVAGPIVRASEFIPQLHQRHDPRRIDASRAFYLIVTGLFMKVVVADFLGTAIVDDVFANPQLYTAREVLVGIYAYAAQIFADFMGYTNIAIGVALLLGFRFPQNFDAPYTALSIQDFWRRWNMTLSRWLRDYLYIPLGGSRGSQLIVFRNLMITMLLGGLWHGASWTFVVWGGLHGLYLCVEHKRRAVREARGVELTDTLLHRVGRRFLTFSLVCFAWIFFRAESFTKAWEVIRSLFTFTGWLEPAPAIKGSILLAIVVAIAFQYVPQDAWARLTAMFSRLRPVPMGISLAVSLLIIDVLAPPGVAPFIYFQF